jgi:hypothetical protein
MTLNPRESTMMEAASFGAQALDALFAPLERPRVELAESRPQPARATRDPSKTHPCASS